MSEFSETSEGVERTLPIESIRVGKKLTITAIPLRRRPNPFSESGGGSAEAFKKEIAEVIEGSDGVIFEYFPEEIPHPSLVSRKYGEIYKNVIDFFSPLVELTREHEKPAYVLDPAYDEKFAVLFHELPEIIGMLGGGTLGTTALLGFLRGAVEITERVSGKDREPEKKEEFRREDKKEVGKKEITRRQFLKGAAGAGVLATAGAALALSVKYTEGASAEVLTGTPSTSRFPSEAKFRRAIIAKGISQLSENLDNNPSQGVRNLVLLYTPMHWQGLKGLLENRKRLDEEFNLYCSLKKGGLDDAFFTARKYEWTGKEWSLEKAEIGGRPGPTI